jgi:alpha-1,6-mannosyltransferase
VHHLPFGIDKDLFTPHARRAAFRAEVLREQGEVPIVIGMGRLSLEKDWPVAVEGFIRASRRQRLVLLLFGDGPERERLEAIVGKRADVRFMGFERDGGRLATALASADAFLHGCPHETFGQSVAQAVASGLPMVVPDRGGAAELAHPSFSEVFRAGNAEACAAALDRLLERGLPKLRDEAITRRARVLDAKEQVQKTVDAYEQLLAARAHRGAGAHL